MGHGLIGRRPAVHRDDQIGAARLQGVKRPRAGAITLGQAVGNIDRQLRVERPKPAHQQCRAGRPVDVIVGEDVNAAAGLQGVDDGGRRRVHVHETGRVGEQRPKRGPQKILALIRRHAARRKRAGHRLVQVQGLHMGADGPRLGRTLAPGTARQRARHVEEGGSVSTVSHEQSLLARTSFRDSVCQTTLIRQAERQGRGRSMGGGAAARRRKVSAKSSTSSGVCAPMGAIFAGSKRCWIDSIKAVGSLSMVQSIFAT
ncbi:hypothetical protein D3C72_1123820 [compost metagenome]